MSEIYRVIEVDVQGAGVIPADVVPFFLRARHDAGDEIRVPGFWDGGTHYRARFTPERVGHWTWATEEEQPGIEPATGEIEVVEGDGHGPVRVASRFHFAHADGTPHRTVGATAYNWLHQDEPLYRETVSSIAEAGFNRLRFMVFPQAGGYVEHVPTLMPFAREGGRWDVTKPDIAFFRRLDAAVETLGSRGIQADVLIFDAYDRGVFGLNELSEEEDAVYLKYLVARLGAYPHVWWSLCNEFDQMERPTERWTRMGELLAAVDAHDHLRSIHNWDVLYDYNQPWVTHACIQNGWVTEEFGRIQAYRDAYRKPIALDEIKYEGDIELRWGNLTARELVHRFWVTTVSGCYASHGESYVTESGSLHMVEGGRLRGESPARLGFLRRVLEEVDGPGLDPIDKWDDPESIAGIARRVYFRYFGRTAPGSWSFRLPQGVEGERLEPGDAFRVEIIDVWNMTITPVERRFVLDEVQRNDAWDRAAEAIPLPEGEMIALRITRVA